MSSQVNFLNHYWASEARSGPQGGTPGVIISTILQSYMSLLAIQMSRKPGLLLQVKLCVMIRENWMEFIHTFKILKKYF